MATKYSPEFKANIIAKMLPPNNVSVPDLAGETQIPKDTLYCWRSKAMKNANGAVASPTPKGVLSSEEKFAVVLETASLNETELSAYCRRKGLYRQQIEAWRTSCMAANAAVCGKADRAEVRAQKLEIRELQKELRRKEKALAEAAALLVLQKKVRALWAEPEDGKSSSRNDEW